MTKLHVHQSPEGGTPLAACCSLAGRDHKLHVHAFTGLKPDALATYLAALGLLRLLSEQKDMNVRGFWRNEHFVLVSELNWDAIERFFLEDYAPTPILAPWSGGGGFLDNADEEGDTATDDKLDDDDLIGQFTASAASRFEAVRSAIAEAQRVIPPTLPLARGERDRLTARLRDVNRTIKQLPVDSDELKSAVEEQRELVTQRDAARKRVEEVKNDVKATLLSQTKRAWLGSARDWFDAAVILGEAGDPSYSFHLGTGGNEGNQDYTAGFQRNLILLFDLQLGTPKPDARVRLDAVLFGRAMRVLVAQTVGQFFPGRAGGTNMGAGFESDAGINPWEFVLMLEGAVALVAGMSRRGGIEKVRARVSSPFWVEGASAGFGSASFREKSKGPPRGEQWLPLWSQPLRYDELVELIREGRAQVGRRQTTRATDLVRAAARLGLARGINSLQRFAYLQRNGDSTFAVSAGRFRVASRAHQALLDEVAPWIDQLARQGREKNAPTSLGVIARRTQEALFTVCRQDATSTLWRKLLVTLGDAELVLLRAGKYPARRPLPRLSSGWLVAVDDGTQEGRTALSLALALASQHRPRERESAPYVDSVRRHFLALVDGDGPHPRFKLDEKGRVLRDPEHVCIGRDLVTDAIALVERRSIWARASTEKRERTPRLPLEAVSACEATPEEIGAWVRGEVPDEIVLGLVRPLLGLKWNEFDAGHVPKSLLRGAPDPLQMLFRLVYLPFDVPVRGPDGRTEAEVGVRLDPEPLRRLAAGDLDGALKVAMRRLDASGLRPVFRRGVATRVFARRLAASLAFPISRNDAARAARLVCKPYDVNDAEEVLSTPV